MSIYLLSAGETKAGGGARKKTLKDTGEVLTGRRTSYWWSLPRSEKKARRKKLALKRTGGGPRNRPEKL